MGRFAGRAAFIAEAGRGPGRRQAVRFAEEGADIIAVDAVADDLAETADLVRTAGGRVVTSEADLCSTGDLTAAVARGVAELGRLDIVLAPAESSLPVAALDIGTGLTGVWKTIRAAVPEVIRGGRGGAVVITSSLAATPSAEEAPARSAASAALVTLMQGLADELGPYGIRVNTVHHAHASADMLLGTAAPRLFGPAPRFTGTAYAGPVAPALTRLPVATLDPDDITNAVLYLASDDGCYVTGTMHVVAACTALPSRTNDVRTSI